MQRAKLHEALNIGQEAIQDAHLPYRVIETEWVQIDRALRFYIEKVSESIEKIGVGMEDCAAVSKVLSEIAQLDELVNGEYNLEVSSPGVERPVRLLRDFQALVGQTLKVRVSGVIDGKRQETGELLSMGGEDFAIKTLKGPWPFKIENVLKANLVYDWSREKPE